MSDFQEIADETLESIFDNIEDENDGAVESDFLNGVIDIKFDSGENYVINKHGPSEQIWLSSPISGAHKFSYDGTTKAWINSDSDDLLELLTEEFEKLGQEIDF